MKKFLPILLFLALGSQAAVNFDGIDDSIQLPNNASLNPSFVTVSTWFNLNSIADRPHLVGKGDGSRGPYWLVIETDGTARFYYTIGAGTWNYIGTAAGTVSAGAWRHIAGVFNGNQAEIFIDGSYMNGEAAVGVLKADDTNPLRLARDSIDADSFSGSLDDVRIYDRALTVQDIQAIYESRSRRPSGSLANGLVAHYEFDDQEINHMVGQAQDDSGNLNHGVFVDFLNLPNLLSDDVASNIGTGKSLNFNGHEGYINLDTDLTTSDTSYSVWFKGGAQDTAGGSVLRPFIIQTSITPGIEDELSMVRDGIADHGKVRCRIGNGTVAMSASTYNDNNWHHAVCRWALGGSVELFVDNQRVATGTAGTSTSVPLTAIGGDPGVAARRFDGSLDDARIYNRVLSNGEIAFLYNGSGSNPGTANLEALWTFDDDSAVKDSSGNDNHGLGLGGDSLQYTEGVLNRN